MSRQTVIRIGALIIQAAILLLIWQGVLHPIRGGLLVLAVGAIASVLQTFALSAWGLGIVTPLISGTGALTPARAIICFFMGAALEAISLTFLAYIPYPEDKTEAKTNG